MFKAELWKSYLSQSENSNCQEVEEESTSYAVT